MIPQASRLQLGNKHSLRVADVGCGLLPLLDDFRSLARACGVRRLDYCGVEKDPAVADEACKVRPSLLFVVEQAACDACHRV